MGITQGSFTFFSFEKWFHVAEGDLEHTDPLIFTSEVL